MRSHQGDEGFTLIEIVISIAILTLLMLPALSGYFTAAHVNRQTQEYQGAITLGQNIAENLKNGTMEEIMLQVNGVHSFELLNSNLNGFSDTYQLGDYIDGGFGEYVSASGGYSLVRPGETLCSVKVTGTPPVYTFEPPVDRSCFYLGLLNVRDHSASYDVLITLDSAGYRDTMKYPGSMNNYRRPELNRISREGATLLDLEGFTTRWSDDSATATYDNSGSVNRQALEYFKNIQQTYINYQESLREAEITPTPAPITVYTEEEIKSAISKEIQVKIKKNGTDGTLQVQCIVGFQCSLDLDRDGSNDLLEYTLYSDRPRIIPGEEYDRQIYLFYTPSEFSVSDTVTVQNDGAKIKLYLVKQDGPSVSGLKIHNQELNAADTYICTNLSVGNIEAASLAGIDEYRLITQLPAKDRIFDLKVEVFPNGAFASNNFTEPLATYHTTKEND